jgi:hypothetical protein
MKFASANELRRKSGSNASDNPAITKVGHVSAQPI